MKSTKKVLVILGFISLKFVLASSLRLGAQRRASEVYSVTSNVYWKIFAPNPYLFSTTEMYYLQKTASSFFEDKIKDASEFIDQNVILVDYKLRDQSVGIGKVEMTLTSELTMTYVGKKMDNFSDQLPMVVNNSVIEDLLKIFIQNGFFEPSTTSSSIKYEFYGASATIANDKLGEYFIIFIALLTISSILVISAIAVFVSTKCSRKKESLEIEQAELDLQVTKTEESEEPASPPGVLGAFVQSNGQAIVTPQRGVQYEFEETPVSQDSNVTDVKSIYSTTSSKAPLGILSMNNLRSMIVSPERKKDTIALYDIKLDDDNDSHNDDVTINSANEK